MLKILQARLQQYVNLELPGVQAGFRTTQGNRLSCRDQEGRRGSEEAVPGPSVFPSGEHRGSRAEAWLGEF